MPADLKGEDSMFAVRATLVAVIASAEREQQ